MKYKSAISENYLLYTYVYFSENYCTAPSGESEKGQFLYYPNTHLLTAYKAFSNLDGSRSRVRSSWSVCVYLMSAILNRKFSAECSGLLQEVF